MKTDWYMYLKLCESTMPEQKDLIEHNCGNELTRLHMNYAQWVVDREDSMLQLRLCNIQKYFVSI